jgi:hypothetical protein
MGLRIIYRNKIVVMGGGPMVLWSYGPMVPLLQYHAHCLPTWILQQALIPDDYPCACRVMLNDIVPNSRNRKSTE